MANGRLVVSAKLAGPIRAGSGAPEECAESLGVGAQVWLLDSVHRVESYQRYCCSSVMILFQANGFSKWYYQKAAVEKLNAMISYGSKLWEQQHSVCLHIITIFELGARTGTGHGHENGRAFEYYL